MAECVRTVFHVDMDAFFVSVEELFDPSLQGKPVVVGGQRHERGVVSAASYEARKFGVHSAMPLRTAARLCPQAIFVDGHPDRYRDCSEKVYSVLTSFSPQVEMVSIDEAYLDMSAPKDESGNAAQLFDRNWYVAPDCESLFRQSQATWCALCGARTRDKIPCAP